MRLSILRCNPSTRGKKNRLRLSAWNSLIFQQILREHWRRRCAWRLRWGQLECVDRQSQRFWTASGEQEQNFDSIADARSWFRNWQNPSSCTTKAGETSTTGSIGRHAKAVASWIWQYHELVHCGVDCWSQLRFLNWRKLNVTQLIATFTFLSLQLIALGLMYWTLYKKSKSGKTLRVRHVSHNAISKLFSSLQLMRVIMHAIMA